MENEVKSLKLAQKVLIIINLFLSMIYTAGVDSLETFDILMYGAVLAGLWYVVKLMNDRINELEESDEEQTTEK